MSPTCNFVPIGPRSASVEGGVVHLNLPRPREGNRLGALDTTQTQICRRRRQPCLFPPWQASPNCPGHAVEAQVSTLSRSVFLDTIFPRRYSLAENDTLVDAETLVEGDRWL